MDDLFNLIITFLIGFLSAHYMIRSSSKENEKSKNYENIKEKKCVICRYHPPVQTQEQINEYCLLCLKKYIFGNEKMPDNFKS